MASDSPRSIDGDTSDDSSCRRIESPQATWPLALGPQVDQQARPSGAAEPSSSSAATLAAACVDAYTAGDERSALRALLHSTFTAQPDVRALLQSLRANRPAGLDYDDDEDPQGALDRRVRSYFCFRPCCSSQLVIVIRGLACKVWRWALLVAPTTCAPEHRVHRLMDSQLGFTEDRVVSIRACCIVDPDLGSSEPRTSTSLAWCRKRRPSWRRSCD